MAEMANYPMESQLGCSLVAGIFRRRSFCQRKTSVYSLPVESSNNISKEKPPVHISKTQRSKSEAAILASNLIKQFPEVGQKLTGRHNLVSPRTSSSHQKNEGRKSYDAARSSTSSSSLGQITLSQTNEAKLRRASTSDSRELSMILTTNNQQSKDSKALVRASSTKVMLLGDLGNLRLPGNGNIAGNNSPHATTRTANFLHRNLQEASSNHRTRHSNGKLGGNGVMGNIVRQSSGDLRQCQNLTSRMDPEVLKNMGNEKYKQGRCEEALAFYDRAIALDSSKATYRSNKSAALIGLGRLTEAVAECKEAIRLDPSYQRAHHRLATLYVRYFIH